MQKYSFIWLKVFYPDRRSFCIEIKVSFDQYVGMKCPKPSVAKFKTFTFYYQNSFLFSSLGVVLIPD